MSVKSNLEVSDRAVEAAAQAIHGGKGCTCRHGAAGDARLALEAALPHLKGEKPKTKEGALVVVRDAMWDAGLHTSVTALREYTDEVIRRIEMAWSS